MDNKNVSEMIEDIRRDITKIFNKKSLSEVPTLSSDTNIFSGQQYRKVHPEKEFAADLEAYKNASFETINSKNNIMEDVKNMRIQLKETYDMLINARDTFEALNFGNLKHRIKHYLVYPSEDEIDELLEKRPLDENLEDLTHFMKQRFKEHSSEFENIPEVNSFFQTCSQLQRGLKDLETQTKELESLETRVMEATEEEIERVLKIKELLNIERTE